MRVVNIYPCIVSYLLEDTKAAESLSSFALSIAALTALRREARRPPPSNAWIPWIVVPPGEHTASFSCSTTGQEDMDVCQWMTATLLPVPVTHTGASYTELPT